MLGIVDAAVSPQRLLGKHAEGHVSVIARNGICVYTCSHVHRAARLALSASCLRYGTFVQAAVSCSVMLCHDNMSGVGRIPGGFCSLQAQKYVCTLFHHMASYKYSGLETGQGWTKTALKGL